MQAAFPIDIRPEVSAALQIGQPVIALTSSPLAHSLPWPANLETVHLAFAAARQEGAVLAVVAVWHGRLTVGLNGREIEALVSGGSSRRASRRDLAATVVKGGTAATTVSASLYLAARAGIPLLVAGALGASAPSDEHTWDVSPDLFELSRVATAVVSGGARSVLSLTTTADILESYGVPVFGYRTNVFPPFYLNAGGPAVTARADTPAEAADLLSAHWSLGGAGAVLAQPTPVDSALSPDELHDALLAVEKQAAEAREVGRDLPPVLMTRLNRLTGGKTLRAYQAILAANTRLAAQVARHLSQESGVRGQESGRLTPDS